MRYLRSWLPIHNDNNGGATGGDNNPPPTPPANPPAGKVFTQADVDKITMEHRKGLQKQVETLTKQIQDVQKSQNLTQQERDEIAANLDRLQNETLTKEEIAQREFQKLQKRLDTETKTLAEERDGWKRQFETRLTQHELLEAATSGKAIKPSQIVELLKGKTKVVPVIGEDGKIIPDQFKTVVSWTEVKGGSQVTLELSPVEVLGRMKENPEEYGNLFQGMTVSGTGSTNGAGGRGTEVRVDEKDFDKYRAARKAGKLPL